MNNHKRLKYKKYLINSKFNTLLKLDSGLERETYRVPSISDRPDPTSLLSPHPHQPTPKPRILEINPFSPLSNHHLRRSLLRPSKSCRLVAHLQFSELNCYTRFRFKQIAKNFMEYESAVLLATINYCGKSLWFPDCSDLLWL